MPFYVPHPIHIMNMNGRLIQINFYMDRLHEVVHKLVHSLNDIGFEIVRKPRIVYREKSRDVPKSNTKA